MPRRPLEGLRVVDLTVWFQGPVAGRLLADYGAEVIHVERPQGGDPARGVRAIRAVPVGDWNQYFLVINRNKKSLALNLNHPQGREVMYRLVSRSDAFITNLDPAHLERWGVAYHQLREVNPRLVYGLASGYGRYGARERPAFDLTVQALVGVMARLGEPGQPPIYLGMGSGDAMGGLLLALGVMLALLARRHTGQGQLVEVSLYGAQLYLGAPTLQAYLATGDPRLREQQSRRRPLNPLDNVFPAEDGWLFLCLPNRDEVWQALCRALERPQWAQDPRFATARGRQENAEDLVRALDEVFSQRGREEWVSHLRQHGLPCASVAILADLAQDPQAWANGYLARTYCHEVDQEVEVIGLPIILSRTPGEVRALGPELGQHTEEILVETLGYSWEEVVRLKQEGVII